MLALSTLKNCARSSNEVPRREREREGRSREKTAITGGHASSLRTTYGTRKNAALTAVLRITVIDSVGPNQARARRTVIGRGCHHGARTTRIQPLAAARKMMESACAIADENVNI